MPCDMAAGDVGNAQGDAAVTFLLVWAFMSQPPKQPGRSFRYSLRSLLIAITIVGLALGWVTRSNRWIQQRHALLTLDDFYGNQSVPPLFKHVAPGGLWLFGERGQHTIRIATESPLSQADRIKVHEARRLFPESTLWLRSSPFLGEGVVNIDLAPGEYLTRED